MLAEFSVLEAGSWVDTRIEPVSGMQGYSLECIYPGNTLCIARIVYLDGECMYFLRDTDSVFNRIHTYTYQSAHTEFPFRARASVYSSTKQDLLITRFMYKNVKGILEDRYKYSLKLSTDTTDRTIVTIDSKTGRVVCDFIVIDKNVS